MKPKLMNSEITRKERLLPGNSPGRFRVLIVLLSGLVSTTLLFAQQRIVTGTVTSNSDGLSLPGVNVVLKGTTTGTVTDTNGSYTIALSDENNTLIYSFVGFETQEIVVGARSTVDVSLVPNVTQLSEITVTGTGVPVERRKLAFAVESVSTSQLPSTPTSNLDQALIGRIPGAQISSIDGTPGAEMSILLRGINTINRGTMPMIMVDGVQMGATLLSSIDVSTIDKVEVVQGAAASSIYGAQGANGVIQIFTKRGKSGKMAIDFSAGWSQSRQLNVGGLRKARYHAFETNERGEVIDPSTLKPLQQDPETLLYNGSASLDLLDPNSKLNKPYGENCCAISSPTHLYYYDHFKVFFEPANLYNANLSLSRSESKYDFNITMARAHHQSNFRGDGYNERTSLVSNVGFEIARGLKLRSITQLIFNKNTVNIWQKQDYGLGFNSNTLFQTRPFADLGKKDTDGNYGSFYGNVVGVNQFNPLYEYQYANTMDKKVDLIQNFSVNYALPKYADFEVLYGINYQDQTVEHNVDNQTLNRNSIESGRFTAWKNYENTGEITTIEKTRTFENLRARSTFRFDLINDFNSSLPLQLLTDIVFDYRSDNFHQYGSSALGVPLIPPAVATSGNTFLIFDDYNEEFVTYGYFINQRVEYKDLAGVSGGFRTDYSSAFGRGSKPFTFPHADGFFRISGLNGWDNSNLSNSILEWKLRAAYGEAGIQPRPFDRYLTLTPRPLGTSNALYVGPEQSNPDLTVEVSKELEVGTDLTIDGFKGNWLKNLNASLSWWKRTTENIIFPVDAPPTWGIGTIIDNALSLKSSGIQLSITANLFKSKNWRWDLTTNFSTQTTIVKDVKNASGEIIVGNRVLREGEKLGQVYGSLMLTSVDQKGPDGNFLIPLDTTQINPETEEKYGPEDVQAAYEVASNGWVVHKHSKRPFITNEKYSLGDPNPDFIMSFISDIGLKKFLSISFQLDWIQGAKLYNNTRQWMYRDAIHSDYEQPITIDGRTGAWTAFYRGTYFPARWEKNYFYEDASFVRLRTVAVSFDFSSVIGKSIFNRLQLVLSGRNLLTWTPYSGLDPEISTYGAKNMYSSQSVLYRGVDDNTLGNFRTYQITLNIGL